jgi:DNA-binding NtrC family response regulator
VKVRLLVVDDEAPLRRVLVELLRASGHDVEEAASGRLALEALRTKPRDLVLLDLHMEDGSGLETLPEIRRLPEAPAVIVLTGRADVHTAVEAMKAGAADFLQKPADATMLEAAIVRALRLRGVSRERDRLRADMNALRAGPILGASRAMERVREAVARVAAAPRTTVLILGESGVGKELVAREIHARSARADGPFVALNCAAIAPELLEAELFGYEGGAFTGAVARGRDGLYAAAEGGTLFLDEVGELAPALQAKFLRVLQEKTYRRVGATADTVADVRILAATNRDLEAEVAAGHFREDLYYRLNVLSISVPPLRERRDDVALLAEHMRARFAAELGLDSPGFEAEALEQLRAHAWPGNVRELKNTVERALLHAREGYITANDLGLVAGDGTLSAGALEGLTLEAAERVLIERALERCGGNRSQAARELGVNRVTLYKKLRAWGISTT